MPRTQSLTSMLVVACAVAGFAGCGGNSATSPDAVPLQVFEGTRNIPARSVAVVPIQIDQSGILRGVVNWDNFLNDIDSGVVRGTCTATQVAESAAGCGTDDALVFENGDRKPSTWDNTPVTPGAHTLIVFNFGGDETFVYRVEVI